MTWKPHKFLKIFSQNNEVPQLPEGAKLWIFGRSEQVLQTSDRTETDNKRKRDCRLTFR